MVVVACAGWPMMPVAPLVVSGPWTVTTGLDVARVVMGFLYCFGQACTRRLCLLWHSAYARIHPAAARSTVLACPSASG